MLDVAVAVGWDLRHSAAGAQPLAGRKQRSRGDSGAFPPGGGDDLEAFCRVGASGQCAISTMRSRQTIHEPCAAVSRIRGKVRPPRSARADRARGWFARWPCPTHLGGRERHHQQALSRLRDEVTLAPKDPLGFMYPRFAARGACPAGCRARRPSGRIPPCRLAIEGCIHHFALLPGNGKWRSA
jgi:hypothetical protein